MKCKRLKTIVKFLDMMSCIWPMLTLSDWNPKNENPIKYGMSALAGFLTLPLLLGIGFFTFLPVICIAIAHPIVASSIVILIGVFVGIGFLRHRVGDDSDDAI